MTVRVEAYVRPELLVWARETSGLSREEAAKRLGVKAMRVEEWEVGDRRPSLPQLGKLADIYKRPFAAFFLPDPPPPDPQIPDFRRKRGATERLSSRLVTELRRARYRRRAALELLPGLGPPDTPLSDPNADPETTGRSIREALRVPLAAQRSAVDHYAALALWIGAVESRRILVFQMSRISTDEVRGFSLFETPLPVVVLNGKDSARARSFTLMHELAHLVFRVGGLCDLEGQPDTDAAAIEAACNRVSAAVLVPVDDFLDSARFTDVAWSLQRVRELADRYWVSAEVVLLRLLTLRRIGRAQYQELKRELERSYDLSAGNTSGGGDYYRTFVRNNGYQFTALMLDAYENERITPAEFAQYTGAKLNHVRGITRVLQRRELAQHVVE